MSSRSIIIDLAKGLLVIAVMFFLIWLNVVSGMEAHEYKWVYSDDNKIKALQYIANFTWNLSWATSPAWICGLMAGLIILLKRKWK